MANEVRVQNYLTVNKNDEDGQVTFQSPQPFSFQADMEGYAGPTPGNILVSRYGTNVDLSQIVLPGGWCFIQNLAPLPAEGDDPNYVTYGTYDVDAGLGTFTPLGELLPGESTTLRLSRLVGVQIGTGSGTASTDTGIALRFKAALSSTHVLVQAFDR